jgi:hypothetical protein
MLILLIVTLASIGTLSWRPSSSFGDEIRNLSLDDNTDRQLAELREGLLNAFKRRDIEGMLTFVTPDVIVTWQNSEVSHGKEELRAFIERMIVGPQSVVSAVDGAPLAEGRKIHENQIISYGRMNDTFTLRATGQKLPFDSRFSALIVRENGRLLLSGLHLSVNAFNNPVLSAQLRVFKMGALGASLAALLGGFLLGRWFGRKR